MLARDMYCGMIFVHFMEISIEFQCYQCSIQCIAIVLLNFFSMLTLIDANAIDTIFFGKHFKLSFFFQVIYEIFFLKSNEKLFIGKNFLMMIDGKYVNLRPVTMPSTFHTVFDVDS